MSAISWKIVIDDHLDDDDAFHAALDSALQVTRDAMLNERALRRDKGWQRFLRFLRECDERRMS